jgi:hypothetical protein
VTIHKDLPGRRARARIGWPRRVPRGLLVALGVLTAIEATGGYLLWKFSLKYRYVEVQSLQSLFPFDTSTTAPIYTAVLRRDSITRRGTDRQKYLRALQWTMNQVSVIGDNHSGHDPEELLKSVRQGDSALCSDMARLYTAALNGLGLPSRTVWLFRNFPGGDTHTTVEVLIDHKWIVLDPTFGIYYRDGQGHLLSAFDIQARLFKGDYADIHPVFAGSQTTRYPARLETYYMNFLPLFNNVFVKPNESPTPWFGIIPPLRYWFGDRVYYERLPGETSNIVMVQRLYFTFIVLLPVVLLLLGASAVVQLLGVRDKNDTPALSLLEAQTEVA